VTDKKDEEIRKLKERIAELEREKVKATTVSHRGSGATVINGGVGAGAGGVAVGGNVHGNIYVGPQPKNAAEALATNSKLTG
jgi:hypothetical protein